MIKRAIAIFLCVIILLPTLAACDKNGDIPDGMYSVTLEGEPFILYVPEQWSDNRDSGISSAYYSIDKHIHAGARYFYCDEETREAGVLAYVEMVEARNSELLNGYKKSAEISDASLGDADYKKYEYTYNYNGNSDDNVTVTQYYTFYGEDVIVLSLYIGTEHISELHNESFDKIKNNFKLCEKNAVNDDVTDKSTPDNMKNASDKDLQYACYVPKEWVTSLNDKLTYAYYPESGKPNVTVTCVSPDNDVDAKGYFDLCEMEYKKSVAGYELLGDPTERTVGGRNALSYEYKAVYGEIEYKIMQTVLIYNSLAYSITYTARADAYDAHLEDVEAILNNFRFR